MAPLIEIMRAKPPRQRPRRPELFSRLAGEAHRLSSLRNAILAARELRSKMIDRWLGIETGENSTRANHEGTTFDDPVRYEATDYILLSKYIKPLQVSSNDVIFEIGCGKGRTLCAFARMPVRRCVGIEYAPELAQQAIANADRLRGKRSPIDVWVGDAVQADYSHGTVFWINNPFGEKTLKAVLSNIEQSLHRSPRRIQIAYIYPFHRNVLDELPWLQCVHREHSIFFRTSEALYWTNEGCETALNADARS